MVACNQDGASEAGAADAVDAEVLLGDLVHSGDVDEVGRISYQHLAREASQSCHWDPAAKLALFDSYQQERYDPDSFASISAQAPPMRTYNSSADWAGRIDQETAR